MFRRRLKRRLLSEVVTLRACLHGAVAVSVLLEAAPVQAQAMKAKITGVSDVNFGTVLNFQTTARSSQSLCVYANSTGGRYSVTAAGGGPGGAFTLYDGARTLTYGVEWSSTAGQSTGTPLDANSTLASQNSNASNQNCTGNGGSTTATLVIALGPSDLGPAVQGDYSGTLFVTVAPE